MPVFNRSRVLRGTSPILEHLNLGIGPQYPDFVLEPVAGLVLAPVV